MKKTVIALIVLIAVVLVIIFISGNLTALLGQKHVITTIPGQTTTIASNSSNTTTIANYSNSTSSSCNGLTITGKNFNTTYNATCISTGAMLGLWVAGGSSGSEGVKIVGADNKTYVNQQSFDNCTAFFENFTLPAQKYVVSFTTGAGFGSCGTAMMVLNTTTSPPASIYDYIYNGDFANGEYTGWNVTNPGFGTAPLNISYQDSKLCFQGKPWANYKGNYFATTYECGTAVAPGNITSSEFTIMPSAAFLNFRVISPDDNQLYIEILRQNYKTVNSTQVYVNTSPIIIAHVNTYNISISPDSSSRFVNVSIPLTGYVGQVLRIRVVAGPVGTDYIAIGDFSLNKLPHQDKGITLNITTLSS